LLISTHQTFVSFSSNFINKEKTLSTCQILCIDGKMTCPETYADMGRYLNSKGWIQTGYRQDSYRKNDGEIRLNGRSTMTMDLLRWVGTEKEAVSLFFYHETIAYEDDQTPIKEFIIGKRNLEWKPPESAADAISFEEFEKILERIGRIN
jgi:hypothetical protein